jgi:hypothetical protein
VVTHASRNGDIAITVVTVARRREVITDGEHGRHLLNRAIFARVLKMMLSSILQLCSVAVASLESDTSIVKVALHSVANDQLLSETFIHQKPDQWGV